MLHGHSPLCIAGGERARIGNGQGGIAWKGGVGSIGLGDDHSKQQIAA